MANDYNKKMLKENSATMRRYMLIILGANVRR